MILRTCDQLRSRCYIRIEHVGCAIATEGVGSKLS